MKFRRVQRFLSLLSATIFLLLSYSPTRQILFAETPNRALTLQKREPSQPTTTPSKTDGVIVDKAVQYADFHRTGVEEARRRLALQEEMRVIYREIQTLETFAGLWLEHDPTFKVVVQFTERGQEALHSYPMSDALMDVVDIRHVAVSLRELEEIQATTWELVQEFSSEANQRVNVKTNRVELRLANIENLRTFLANKQVLLSKYVVLIEQYAHVSNTADIHGGLKLNSTGLTNFSTSGFSVMSESTGSIGLTTTGHSPDTKDYLGVNLPFVAGTDSGNYDIQWHLPATYTVKPFIFDGSNNLLVIDLRPYNDQMIGETVCKYGQTTGYGCGTIISKIVNGLLRILVDNTMEDLAEVGDSGGPWFSGNTAYGTQLGQIQGTNQATYMPINFVDILNLCILRSPVSPSTPNLSGSLNSGQVRLSWTNPDNICGHAVYRSTSPYFTPSSSNLVNRYKKSVVGFNSSVGVGDVNNNYTYLIRPVIGFNETTSKRIGEFDFAIVPVS